MGVRMGSGGSWVLMLLQNPYPHKGRADLGGYLSPFCLHLPQMVAHADKNTVPVQPAWVWLSHRVTLSRSLSTCEPQPLSEKWGEACPLHKMLMRIKGADGTGSRARHRHERSFLLHE